MNNAEQPWQIVAVDGRKRRRLTPESGFSIIMTKHIHLYVFAIVFVLVWSLGIYFSGYTAIVTEKQKTVELAKKEALTTSNKDQSLRFWATDHGGVYVPISAKTPPNKYLSHIPNRDITTPSGQKLTLMNPAYMMKQVMADYGKLYGAQGYITSLKALNPLNKAADWQRRHLEILEKGDEKEVFEITQSSGASYLRLMRPIPTKEGCLKCHGFQGYKVGDLRGGIGVEIAMAPYLLLEQQTMENIIRSHFIFWVLGMLSVASFTIWGRARISKDNMVREALTLSNHNLKVALEEVKTLRGIIPICAYCKKIRNDTGSWERIEAYICNHSEAQFSHGACPQCFEQQMAELGKGE